MHRALIAAATLLAAAPASAEEQEAMNMDDVPAEVMQTALETAPGIEFYKVSMEIENGVTIYEFEGTSFEGRHIEIDVRADGSLEEIELHTLIEEVPAAVLDKLAEAAPNMEPIYIEMSIRDGLLVYEFECASVDGDIIDVEIDEDGQVLVITNANVV